jgi:predicted nucleic acid-binding protein
MSARDAARTVGAEMIYSEDFQSGALGGLRVVNPFAT